MSDTNNVKLGVCTVFFDGNDLGFTKGGVEVEVASTTHQVKVDQLGDTPINELITGRTVTAKVPMAETTLANLAKIMPGARLVTDGAAASGTATFATAAAADGDKVIIGGISYTFKTAPTAGKVREIAPGATFGDSATNLAAAINADTNAPFTASVLAGVVTITSDTKGVAGNDITLTKTGGTNITLSGAKFTGGTDATAAKVVVPTGVNLSLLDYARELVLRPLNTNGDQDFVIYRAATPGAMQFAYKYDDERVFQANFMGYPQANGDLFEFGDQDAVEA